MTLLITHCVIRRKPHPYVPDQFQCIVLDSLHSLPHPGIRATQRLVTDHFFWPRQQRYTITLPHHLQHSTHMMSILTTSTLIWLDHFQHHKAVYIFLHACIDRFTWWPEAIPISGSTAETVAHALLTCWISRFGVSSTDRGQQSESSLWTQLMQLLGSHRIRTISYHPIANELVEQLTKVITKMLTKILKLCH